MIKTKPEQLKFIIKMNGLNIKQFAKEVGLTRQSIHNALSGKPVGWNVIGKLLRYSNLEFNDLFFIDDIQFEFNNKNGEEK